MRDDSELREAFRQLARYSPRDASPALEEQLLSALHKRRRTVYRYWLAAAACFALAFALVFWQRRPGHQRPPAVPTSRFVLLPYGQSGVPLEHGIVVRMQVPSAAGPVNADVLVGQDGIARAIRYRQ